MKRPEREWNCGPPWRRDHTWGVRGQASRVRFFRRVAAVAFATFLLAICGLVWLSWIAITKLFGVSLNGAAVWVPIGTVLVAFVAALAFLRIFRRVGGPFRDVMDAAERVADGDYSVRIAERGPPPIRGLARAFNTMTERLGKHEQLRRNLMADVAHELRTPLTIIQGKLEGLLDGVYPRDDAQLTEVLGELHLLSRLIEDLRTLALSDAGALKLEKELTDVSALAQDVIRAFRTEASAQQVTLEIEAPAGLPLIMIDGVRIRQVLNNLLSNALRHTPPGGSIETSVGAPDQTAILVQVRDTGSGMSQEEVERAFERFQKGPGSRGSGLGLTIARNLVVAHGGEIQALSQPGSGTTIRFTLPFEPLQRTRTDLH
jgi:two-component system sensor histidine kinase BaeS